SVIVTPPSVTTVQVPEPRSQLAPRSRGPPMLWQRHGASPLHTGGGHSRSPLGTHSADATGTTRAKPTTTNSRVSAAATTVRYIDPPLGSVSGRAHGADASPETWVKAAVIQPWCRARSLSSTSRKAVNP